MYHYAGKLTCISENSTISVVDGAGKIMRETKVASEPEALIAWFRSSGLALRAGSGLKQALCRNGCTRLCGRRALRLSLLETRHIRDALKSMPVKSDRNDARGIAQLMRLGWFRPVHCKSIEAQETRAVLTARKLLQSKLRDIENSLRGVLRGFGLKVGKTTEPTFAARYPGAGGRSSPTGTGGQGAAQSPCRAAGQVQWPGQAHARSSPARTHRPGC